uniref:isocitrate lyase/PEP mutase family protein n=1 Tax=uncultured Sneathiella sp. TaxID=879315 RepID=UPI0030DB1150
TLLPGAANALAARIMEDIGFEALYLTGAGFTNTQLGQPDLGLVTATEIIDAATRIGDVSNLPLIVDMDTGFGNALNAYNTVRKLERAGAAGIQIEDQVFPKKCGHFSGKAVIPIDEMLGKLRACLDARRDENTLIIARTDARAVDGFEAALERAHRMAEEGVDMLFVEAPESIDEIRTISELETPQLINFVFGGRTPIMSAEDLKTYGFSFLLYANVALQASIKAMQDVLTSLYETGSLDQVEDRLATFSERQRVVGKPEIDEIAKRYEGS